MSIEQAIRHQDPMLMPILIAKAKAAALIERNLLKQRSEPLILVTADQITLFKDQVREKPDSPEQAAAFLRSYSDSTVRTVSAVVVTHLPSGEMRWGVDVAVIEWEEISEEVVQRVVERGHIFSRYTPLHLDTPVHPCTPVCSAPVHHCNCYCFGHTVTYSHCPTPTFCHSHILTFPHSPVPT
jgi:predicted house-cleaning NTP pyrophosphatase (Maf/HAM1 superfamily)